jgi:predicted Kef-type K+ transport protein
MIISNKSPSMAVVGLIMLFVGHGISLFIGFLIIQGIIGLALSFSSAVCIKIAMDNKDAQMLYYYPNY